MTTLPPCALLSGTYLTLDCENREGVLPLYPIAERRMNKGDLQITASLLANVLTHRF